MEAQRTMAHVRPSGLMVLYSSAPSSSIDLKPSRTASLASVSRGILLKHQRQTDCLMLPFAFRGSSARRSCTHIRPAAPAPANVNAPRRVISIVSFIATPIVGHGYSRNEFTAPLGP